jgi:hypothetical protein
MKLDLYQDENLPRTSQGPNDRSPPLAQEVATYEGK